MKFGFLIGVLLFFGCNQQESSPLIIAGSANTQFVLQDIKLAFEKETGIQTELVLGSSGKLTAQIEQGAPYHVFLSADEKYPEELYKMGVTLSAPKTYTIGKLVLWSIDSLFNFQRPLSQIAIANPEIAPYGKAAEEVMLSDWWTSTHTTTTRKCINIAQVNQYITTGSIEAGFTSKSTVLSTQWKNSGRWISIPDSCYSPIRQSCVVIKQDNTQKANAEKFIDFLFSPTAKQIFAEYGYEDPSEL